MSQQPFRRNYVQHALAVASWLRTNRASGSIDAATYRLDITHNSRTASFLPQFMTGNGDTAKYVPQLQPEVNAFVSWLPRAAVGWPAAQGKIAFKAFAKQMGLKTPAWTHDLAQVKGAFIIKHNISSFGKGLRGPFFAGPPPADRPTVTLEPGAYAEQLVVGTLMKTWYWNGQVAVVEQVPMPRLCGDGRSTLQELLVLRLGAEGVWTEVHTGMVALWGLTPDFVPPEGKEVVVDYRYMSDLNPAINADWNIADRIRGTPLEAQLAQAGQAMNQVVGPEIGQAYAITIDAVLDATGRVQFLEANCNPLLHPAFYTPMLDAIFNVPETPHLF